MIRALVLSGVVLALGSGCDAADPAPLAYDDVEEKPVAVGGWTALGASTEYPEFARRAGIEGEVAVQLTVTEGGADEDARVTASPNDLLSEAAVRSLTEAAYEPGHQAGEPVDVRLSVCTTFRLEVPTKMRPC